MPEGRKITKDEANYRAQSTKRHCEDCSMFRPPASCTLVASYIARFGTCRFWERKRKED